MGFFHENRMAKEILKLSLIFLLTDANTWRLYGIYTVINVESQLTLSLTLLKY